MKIRCCVGIKLSSPSCSILGYRLVGWSRRKIKLIESNAKCRNLKKFTCKGTLGAGVYFSEPPPLLGFCLGWGSSFVGSESGQIQSVKLLQNFGLQHNSTPPPPPPQTGKEEGGGGESERVRGAIIHKAGSKY